VRRRTTKKPPALAESSTLALLQRVRAGEIDAASLAPAERQRLVEHLKLEGVTVTQVAEIMRVSERTIARDLKEVRARRAESLDELDTKQVIGTMMAQAEAHRSRLMRIAREPGAGAMAQVQAERGAWEITRDVVDTLFKTGFLAPGPHAEGAVGDEEDAAALVAEIGRVVQVFERARPEDAETARTLDAAAKTVRILTGKPAKPAQANSERGTDDAEPCDGTPTEAGDGGDD
jgi:transposase